MVSAMWVPFSCCWVAPWNFCCAAQNTGSGLTLSKDLRKRNKWAFSCHWKSLLSRSLASVNRPYLSTDKLDKDSTMQRLPVAIATQGVSVCSSVPKLFALPERRGSIDQEQLILSLHFLEKNVCSSSSIMPEFKSLPSLSSVASAQCEKPSQSHHHCWPYRVLCTGCWGLIQEPSSHRKQETLGVVGSSANRYPIYTAYAAYAD